MPNVPQFDLHMYVRREISVFQTVKIRKLVLAHKKYIKTVEQVTDGNSLVKQYPTMHRTEILFHVRLP